MLHCQVSSVEILECRMHWSHHKWSWRQTVWSGFKLFLCMEGCPYLVGSAFGADISCLGWGPQTSGDLAEVWFDQLRDWNGWSGGFAHSCVTSRKFWDYFYTKESKWKLLNSHQNGPIYLYRRASKYYIIIRIFKKQIFTSQVPLFWDDSKYRGVCTNQRTAQHSQKLP